MKIFKLIFVCVFATACTPSYRMVNPNVNQMQANRDTVYCKQYAKQAVIAEGNAGTLLAATMTEIREERNCLQGLGYFMQEIK